MQILNAINNISPLQRYDRNSSQPARGAAPGLSEPQDQVTLSRQGREKSKQENAVKEDKDLAPEEKQQVNQLKKRDAEVKAHEAAHMAAGGAIVQGGASYQYQRGPDGKMYAVGGEVKIDMSPERTPEATIRKMQQVKAAALAPAQPSGTDRAVAARASQVEAQARSEKSEELKESSDDRPTDESRPINENQPVNENQPTDSSNPVADGDSQNAGMISAYAAGNGPSANRSSQALGGVINLTV